MSRELGRKTYRTLQGKELDLDLLRVKNELTPAVGNAKVNARGDELGPGGKIIRKQEDAATEYNTTRPDSVKPTPKVTTPNPVADVPQEEAARPRAPRKPKTSAE